MNVVDLTRKLISIPSYVDAQTNERQLGAFISSYLRGLGYLQVEEQPVEGGRFNIVAHDGSPPRLMFCCHMDTVPASGSWKYDPFNGEIVGDRLYGLGASDMKGGIACLLHALTSFRETSGLWLLFDVDEEYYFKGMHRFLEKYEVHPDLAVFPEPGLKIYNGHRGLIEIYFRVRGVTGHAARPQKGKNAILGATQAVEHLLGQLQNFSDSQLGESSCNLAFLRGGVDRGEDVDGDLAIEERANKIPDIAEVVLDMRPAVSQLRAQVVLDIIETHLKAEGFYMEKAKKRLDYGSLLIPRAQLGGLEAIVQAVLGDVRYADISEYGYGEGQLLNERFGVNCVYFGPGSGETEHQVDEFVSVKELEQVCEIYQKLIEQYCLR